MKQRQDPKANEMFEFYKRTGTDEELSQTQGKDSQPKLLGAVINSEVFSSKTAVQQQLVTEEHIYCTVSSKVNQQDAVHLHTKVNLWTNQDKEQFNCLEENVTILPVTTTLLKDEDSEEKSRASSSVQLNQTQGSREAEAGNNSPDEQMQTETEAFRGAETTRSPDSIIDRKTLGSFMPEVRNDDGYFVYEYWQKPLSDSELESEDSDGGFNDSNANKSGLNTDEGHSSSKNPSSAPSVVNSISTGFLSRNTSFAIQNKAFPALICKKWFRGTEMVDSDQSSHKRKK